MKSAFCTGNVMSAISLILLSILVAINNTALASENSVFSVHSGSEKTRVVATSIRAQQMVDEYNRSLKEEERRKNLLILVSLPFVYKFLHYHFVEQVPDNRNSLKITTQYIPDIEYTAATDSLQLKWTLRF